MKKQTITKQDIERNLLVVLKKRKAVTVWLTAFLSVSTCLYILYVAFYASKIYLPFSYTAFISPIAVMVVVPIIIAFMVCFLIYYYYLKFFEIKRGKFSIFKEKLSKKEREQKSYYRHVKNENVLYFSSARITVDDEVYSFSNVGDCFYLVKLKSSKTPFFAYNANYYEIN